MLWIDQGINYVFGLVAIGPFVVFVLWFLTTLGTRVREELAGHELNDPHFCRRCGYDRTGNQSGICPECGTPFPPAL